jgi:hypothetical protein
MVKRLAGAIAGLGIFTLGLGANIGFITLAILSLPLNVLVWMRWTGWEWWSALIAAVISLMIPVVGQLGYVVLTFVGLYYFHDAGWNWAAASHPFPKTFSVKTLSPEEFERFKSTTIKPELTKQCLDDAKNHGGFEGKIPERAAKFCECYAKVAMTVATQEDFAVQESGDRLPPSDLRFRIENKMRSECLPGR